MAKDFDIQKLKGSENYHTWQFAITNLLAFNGLSKCIQTVKVAATADTEETIACAEASAEKKEKAKAMIVLAVEQSIYVHINKCKDALSVWQTLQKLYEDNGLTRKIGLLRSLIQCRLEDCDNVQDFVDKVMSTANKLTGIGFDISNEWLGAILLAGLTDEYAPMIMTIESNNQEISADAIISKLMDIKTGKSGAAGEAFLAKKNNYAKKNKKRSNKKRRCYICSSEEHLANVCPQKSANKGNKKEQKSDTVASAFMVAMLGVQCKRDEWYVDSGASSHMSPFSDILIEKKDANVGDITTANNAKLPVSCIGKSKMKFDTESVDVNDILHIPKLSANLLSVYRMVCQGNTIVFDVDGCKIYNRNKKLLVTIKPENGIYKLCAPIDEVCMLANSIETNAMMWHRRLGHLNFGTLCKLNEAVVGVNIKGNDMQIKQCKVCDLGKQQRKPFPISETRTTKILELVHTDLCGPMETKSMGGARYMLTFTDDYSRKTFLYFLKEKSQVFKCFVEFKKMVENETDQKIKRIRSDNGMEYLSEAVDEYCKNNGIQHQLTCVYTPQQNGVAERANRTIIERGKCMLFDGSLETKFWAEACGTAAYIMNRTPRNRLQYKTPIEMWSGEKPNVSNLRIFGSKVMVHVPKEKRKKWSAKASEMIFIGYDSQKKGYRCFDSQNNKVIVSRDVNFYESLSSTVMMNGGQQSDDAEKMVEDPSIEQVNNSDDDQFESIDDQQQNDFSDIELDNTITSHQNTPSALDRTLVNHQSTPYVANDTMTEDDDDGDDDKNDDDYRTRAKTDPVDTPRKGKRERKQVRPFQIAHFALIAGEPCSVREAFESNDHEKWKIAMQEEMSSHKENCTWTLTSLPPGRKAIRAKWVFKLKSDGNGKANRYKARLVAKGYAQKAGIDYTETFSPVVRHGTIRFLMALAAQNEMKIFQMDAITAFLQGELSEEIFLEQPEMFNDGTSRVCKLNKAIYGLKQAGRVWNRKLDDFLVKMGFAKSQCDPCVYVKSSIIIAVYVDDLLIFYKNVADLNETKGKLHKMFKMKDIGEAKCCLGININQGIDFIELNQSKYILFLLEKFGMAQCKPCKTPSELNKKLTMDMVDDSNTLTGKVPYQELVGSLLYLANGTRPDIAYATSEVSRFNANHSEEHWTAAKRILRYLRGTVNYKLRYERKGTSLQAYSDADWGSEGDSRKSRTGYVVTMAGAAISWCSKKQPIVALSSTEAEYIALSSTVREAIWTVQLREEIIGQKVDEPVVVHCDNQSSIKLALSEAYRPRTKHIDIRLHHVRDQVETRVICLKYIHTDKQVADSLTKSVTAEKTAICAVGMGLKNQIV